VSKKERKRQDKRKLPKHAQIWWDALEDLRGEFEDRVRTAKPDQLRFQNRSLTRFLSKRVPKYDVFGLFFCYKFITQTPHLGYDEPVRLHSEEMQAAGFRSPPSFCKTFHKACVSGDDPFSYFELLARIDSIASWTEAQESFSHWLAFRHHRAAWRGDTNTRRRGYNAWILAKLVQPQWLYEYEFEGRKTKGARVWEGFGLGVNADNLPWNNRQWANILEQAARLANKGEPDCTPLEKWVWWCYPVFQRYRWSAREVQDAASFRNFVDTDSWKVIEKSEANFRKYWIDRGLRFAGRKSKRTNPTLAEFVRSVSLPDSDKVRRVPIWG